MKMSFEEILNLITNSDTVMHLTEVFKKTAIVLSTDDEIFESFVESTIKNMEKHMDKLNKKNEEGEDE